MTDVTQGQDAPTSTPAEKPDVDTLFGAKDVDDLFPANYKAPDPANRNASPIHDFIFSSPLHAPSRVLDAFGYGFKQDWGAGSKSLSEADEYLRKAGVYNDYANGQRNVIKAANEAVMRPAVAAILAAKSVMGGVMHGAQEAVVQAGEEVGAPRLGRELAAVPEAFPTGFHHATGIPRFGEMPETITQAKELDVIGAGEGGYFGTAPAEPTQTVMKINDHEFPMKEGESSPVVQSTAPQPEMMRFYHGGNNPTVGGARWLTPYEDYARNFRAMSEPNEVHFVDIPKDQVIQHGGFDEINGIPRNFEAPEEIAKQLHPLESAKGAASEPQPDIHAVARQIAPDTFHEFDALAQKKDTFRRWIDELREVRDQTAHENAPHATEIADLEEKLKDATPRLAKKYQARLEPLVAERDRFLGEQTKSDSADMAKVRQQLMETDYRMRDLAGDVSKAYRDAETKMPQAAEVANEGPLTVAKYVDDYVAGRGRDSAEHQQFAANNASEIEAEFRRRASTQEVGSSEKTTNEPGLAQAPTEIAGSATPREPSTAVEPTEVKEGAKAEAPTPVDQKPTALPIAHAPSIVADVSQKLKAAGRPAEEAAAAAQIVAAYWETRAQRFEGAKGTAAEMYARETPEIVAGKEKPSRAKKARELELAQNVKTFEQSAQTPAFKEWFGDSKVVDAEGSPRVVYHGTTADIGEFDASKGGSATGAKSAEKGFFFSSNPEVAGSYAVGHNAYKENPFFRFINKMTGGLYEKANEALLAKLGTSSIQHGENIVPAYLSIKNPMEVEFKGQEYRERSFADLIDEARVSGHDGVVFKDAVDPGFKGGESPSDIYVAFEPNQIKSATGNRGTFDPNSAKIYEQEAKGRIRVRDEGRNTITLMKTADASTFIHETGHDWLDRMLKDSKDEQAPEILKNDAQTVMKWLGVDSAEGVKTSHHEKFARGFETYMMEGRAPSQGLARVFAKFKDWLTTIYKTVKALKSPISDDIRGVFDRLLAEKPGKTVIAPEREIAGGLAEKHEALAEGTGPERAHEVANTIEGERDSNVDPNLLEKGENDTRLANTGTEAEGRAAGSAQPSGHADASRPVSGEAEAPVGSGAERSGGSEASAEGTQPRKESERLAKAPTPILKFLASQGGVKTSDALISDLRQSLGGKNHYIPGFGQVIRTPKQLSAAAASSGKLEAMSLDRAREAAIEAGLLPHGASIRDLIDAIDNEVRGTGHIRDIEPAEQAHAEHSFLEGLNDDIKKAGGAELTDAERARALELYNKEGLHDPAAIIERLALEADDAEIEHGAPERAPGVSGWDEPAPGWDTFDERPDARGPLDGSAPAQPGEPRGATARAGSEAEKLDATTDLPRPDTQLVDKAGNIRLDNLGTPEDVNAVIRATAEATADFSAARRDVIPDSEVLALAEALGMGVEQLSSRKLGQAFNAEQIVAARKLLIKSATDVRDAAAKIAGGTEADVMAYAQARARHLMIQEQVSGITAEAGRALRAFRDLGGSKEAADLSAFLKNTQGKTLYQMKEEGALLAMMGTPQQVSKAVHDASLTRWQKIRAGILSWFINDLISGPITHAGYTVGNTVTQVFKATVDTSVAAAYGAFRDLPPGERVYFGEVGAQLYGMVRGMRDGYSPAVTALKTGVPYMKGDVGGMIGQIEAAHRPQAIPGAVGYAIETPSRAVTAIHTMHYSMNYESEIARRAFRSAMKDGLEPGTSAFNTKIADFTQSPPAAEMEAAHNEALKMVLMKSAQFGTAQYHLQRAVNSNILAKIVMPFMQVGANILHESFIERTPLGLMSQTVRDNLTGKNGEVAKHTQASRIAVGIGISTAVVGLTAEGILTGGGPSDPKQLAIKEMTGWRPYSIKVGESYVPYRKYLGGMGPLIAGTADMYEVGHALNEEGLTKAAASSLFGFAEVIADESWAKGLSNFIDAARHWDRDGGRYLRNLAADFIPFSVGLAQVTNLSDPYRREVRTMLDSARAHIPGLSQGLFPVRDIWGEPILSHTALGPSQVNNDPATKALLDAGYYPGKLERKIRGVELTDQQYDDFTRIGGRMARMRMNALVNIPGFSQMPKQVQSEKIKDIIESARESARSMIIMQSVNGPNDILAKARDTKLAKLKGEPAKPETVH